MTNNKKNLFSFVLFFVPLGFRFIPCLPLSERVRLFFLLKLSDAKQKKHLLLKRTCKKTIWKQKTLKNSRRKKKCERACALSHNKKVLHNGAPFSPEQNGALQLARAPASLRGDNPAGALRRGRSLGAAGGGRAGRDGRRRCGLSIGVHMPPCHASLPFFEALLSRPLPPRLRPIQLGRVP